MRAHLRYTFMRGFVPSNGSVMRLSLAGGMDESLADGEWTLRETMGVAFVG